MALSDATIRPLGADEFGVWSPLWQGYLAFYRARVPDEVTRASFARLTGASPVMGGFLAWRGGAAVGMVNWITHPSTWTAGDYCYLQDLFVDPATRGGGVGRKLIEAVYETARERGCSRVYWLTHESNTEAMMLYDKVAERSGMLQYRKMM